MTAPDTTPAIASLLDEAAELAAAANGKLDEALAIAERVEAFNEDRAWFKARPDRSYRARLATQQEIADLHASGAWPEGWTLDPACFVCRHDCCFFGKVDFHFSSPVRAENIDGADLTGQLVPRRARRS